MYFIYKRGFDLFFSLIGLILSSPLWIIISILIYMEDRGPVFYTQKRVGLNGKLFTAYKFRTMISESDKLYGYTQAKADDNRITKIGKILRSTAMDELPQLLSILKGDMSFVGPRALVPNEKETGKKSTNKFKDIKDIPGYEIRHSVKPGLTGIAQIYAARDISREDKFKFDLIYIKNKSFFLDIKLFLLSFWITFKGKWESRDKKF